MRADLQRVRLPEQVLWPQMQPEPLARRVLRALVLRVLVQQAQVLRARVLRARVLRARVLRALGLLRLGLLRLGQLEAWQQPRLRQLLAKHRQSAPCLPRQPRFSSPFQRQMDEDLGVCSLRRVLWFFLCSSFHGRR